MAIIQVRRSYNPAPKREERPKCPDCGATVLPRNMSAHSSTVHAKRANRGKREKKKCSVCGAGVKASKLAEHQRSVHRALRKPGPRSGVSPAGGARATQKSRSSQPERSRIPVQIRNKVIRRDGGVCQICGCKTVPVQRNDPNPRGRHVDHIKPWPKGGRHTVDNLQVLCARCNKRKGTKQGTLRKVPVGMRKCQLCGVAVLKKNLQSHRLRVHGLRQTT